MMKAARYALLLLAFYLCLIVLYVGPARAGDVFSSGTESSAGHVTARYVKESIYYTPNRQACLFAAQPAAIQLGNDIAYGNVDGNLYNTLLAGNMFGAQGEKLEPLYTAYAFYVVAEYIGDREAKKRQYWLARYIPPVIRQRITGTITAKYSPAYLEKCFRRTNHAASGHARLTDIYPLHMD